MKTYIVVSVPLRGVGCFQAERKNTMANQVSVPLRGVGCFGILPKMARRAPFPSPCGVWAVSVRALPPPRAIRGFRPLAGCGLFRSGPIVAKTASWFPSPCGVWVVSRGRRLRSVRRGVSVPLRGVGCFENRKEEEIRVWVSVPLRGVGCFGKAAHSFWCNRKKNCQLCYFIVSYWQMFINSKLRNCKVPCEAHKTAT